MAVIVKYVVVRDGKEDMIFTTKKEADAYDKMLDIAEHLYAYLQRAELKLSDDQLDELTFFMARHRDPIGQILRGGKPATTDAKPSASPKDTVLAATPDDQDAPSAAGGETVSKRSRTSKSKVAA